jgi:hypothetical protein
MHIIIRLVGSVTEEMESKPEVCCSSDGSLRVCATSSFTRLPPLEHILMQDRPSVVILSLAQLRVLPRFEWEPRELAQQATGRLSPRCSAEASLKPRMGGNLWPTVLLFFAAIVRRASARRPWTR